MGRAISGVGSAGVIPSSCLQLAGANSSPASSVYVRRCPGAGIESVASGRFHRQPLGDGVFGSTSLWLPLLWWLSVSFSRTHQSTRNFHYPKLARLYLLGTAIFVSSITALLLALQWGGRHGWANSASIILLAAFTALIGTFGWLQHRKGDSTTLPTHINAAWRPVWRLV